MENSYILMTYHDLNCVKYLVIQNDDKTLLLDTFNESVSIIDDYCDFINEIDFTQEVIINEKVKKCFEEWVLENIEFINKEVIYNLGKVLH